MTGPFADRLFRIIFALAGVYNLAFGLVAGFWPLAVFRFFEIAPPRYPGIWACLGMVVGVYGLLYWHAAWKLETGWPIIAVGLLGKVLGPIGMVASFSNDWPQRLGMLCVLNDLIWWLPFVLFLIRGTRVGRRIEGLGPWFCVLTHAAALAMLAVLLRKARSPKVMRQCAGSLLRATSRRGPLAGQLGWRPPRAWSHFMRGGAVAWRRSKVATAAVLIAGLGMVCDYCGEGSAILRLTEHVPAAHSVGESTTGIRPRSRGLSVNLRCLARARRTGCTRLAGSCSRSCRRGCRGGSAG